MTSCTCYEAYTARAAADLSSVTDIWTDTANIGKNSLHLMHSMQPKRDMLPLPDRKLHDTTDFSWLAYIEHSISLIWSHEMHESCYCNWWSHMHHANLAEKIDVLFGAQAVRTSC